MKYRDFYTKWWVFSDEMICGVLCKDGEINEKITIFATLHYVLYLELN